MPDNRISTSRKSNSKIMKKVLLVGVVLIHSLGLGHTEGISMRVQKLRSCHCLRRSKAIDKGSAIRIICLPAFPPPIGARFAPSLPAPTVFRSSLRPIARSLGRRESETEMRPLDLTLVGFLSRPSSRKSNGAGVLSFEIMGVTPELKLLEIKPRLIFKKSDRVSVE